MTSVFVSGSMTLRIGATDCFLIGKNESDFDACGFEKNKYDEENLRTVDKAIQDRIKELEENSVSIIVNNNRSQNRLVNVTCLLRN